MLNRLSRPGAIALLLLVALAAVWCALASPPPSRVGTMKITDSALYARVIEQVRAGEPYYPVVTALQRENGAPLRPFVTVRLPVLAYTEAALGPGGVRGAALALLAANALAFALLMRRAGMSLIEQVLSAGLVVAGGMLVFVPSLLVWHEIWAGLLLGLALAAIGLGRWRVAVPLALLAVMVRELALPFVLLALALAAWERDRRQGAAWGLVLLVFVVALVLHRHMVEGLTQPGDIASPGWNGLRGLGAVADSFHDLTLLGALPRPVSYMLGLLPLLGWASLPVRQGRFAVLFFTGYGLMLALVARPDNYYWAELMLPAWFAALPLVPRGFVQLAQRARGAAATVPEQGL